MCFEKYESSTKMYRICDHFSNEHNIYKYPPCILSSESRDQTMWRTRIAFPVDLITIVSAGKKIINAKLLSQWRTFVLAVRSSKAASNTSCGSNDMIGRTYGKSDVKERRFSVYYFCLFGESTSNSSPV
ncbi:uncharacterized protein LOC111266590 isoform X2 [Varroa jacobsoni]|uniref:uncharacterized protein LOC111266590 isoform X2 n=1 Tax=Varroa jacobsoni TaxID=62625 RepID=UPI000BFA66F0|nr:uncharacterized protein LOC111266590 isoform X2 [Varroa jacobsoni]